MQPNVSAPLPSIRRDLKFTVHRQSGQLWYSVQDPANDRLFRLGQREAMIASRLSGNISAEQLAAAINQENETSASELRRAVTELEILQLVGWLQKNRFIEAESSVSSDDPTSQWSVSLLHSKFSLIPGKRLEKLAAPLAPYLTRGLCIGVLLTYLVAFCLAVIHWNIFSSAAGQLFVSDGQLWWGLAWLVLKAAHELGHAAVAVKVKCRIRSAGVSIVYFAPIPFVDVSDLWSISNRWQRIACSAGGILVEMTLASVAAIVAVTFEHESLRYLCCAIATLGTINTLAFNANPLMRFDGYFILSDLLNLPNLWTISSNAFKTVVGKLLFPLHTAQQAWPSLGMSLYGGACAVYRVGILVSLAASVILIWDSVGVALVLWGGYATVIAPWIKMRRFQALNHSELSQRSWREWIWCGAVLGTASILMWMLPSPFQRTAPGIINHHQPTLISAEASGVLEEIHSLCGDTVEEGDVIIELSDPTLELELKTKRIETLAAREAIRLNQVRGSLGDLQSEEARLQSLLTQLGQLENKAQRLLVRAPHSGRIVTMPIQYELGRNVKLSETICVLARNADLEACISASQRDVEAFRSAIGNQLPVRLPNGSKVQGTLSRVDPRGSDVLAEPLLAASYAGPLPVEILSQPNQSVELRLPDPRFNIHILLDSNSQAVPGQLVWVRVPNRSDSLMKMLQDWTLSRWDSLKQQTSQQTSN